MDDRVLSVLELVLLKTLIKGKTRSVFIFGFDKKVGQRQSPT